MTSPEVWDIPLRTLTPAFIGGAAPNEQAELRVASLRGALRMWYRLIVGPELAAGLPEAGPLELRESLLFGGTAPGEGQGLVLLSLLAAPPTGKLPWDNRTFRRTSPGRAYLGFSLDMGDNARKALPPGTTFTLRVLLRQGVTTRQRELLAATLWAWINLGGIGSRSRRGFGSLTLDKPITARLLSGEPIPPIPELLVHLTHQDLTHGARRLRAVIASLNKTVSSDPTDPAYTLQPDGPHQSRLMLWTRQGFASAEAAHEAFGAEFSQFRKQPGIDGLGGSALGLLQRRERLRFAPRRAAFGLPLALRPVGRPGDGFELRPYATLRAHGKPVRCGRAPSPLLVSVVRLGPRFGVALTLLSGTWPGRDLPLQEQRQERGFIESDPDNDLPVRLLHQLKGVEVWP
jgi:CRISPR-associated protein Cmr1